MTEIKTKKYQDFEINIIPALRDNYIYLLKCFKANKTICVDPGEFGAVDSFLQICNWGLDYIVVTHRHLDHVAGIEQLKAKYNCKVIAFGNDKSLIPEIDIEIDLNQELKVENLSSQIVSHETIKKNNEIMAEFEMKTQFINNIIDVSHETIVIYDDFKLGEIIFRPFSTFGHCSNHISYFISPQIHNLQQAILDQQTGESNIDFKHSEKCPVLFCGDTLFSSGCGRVFADGNIEELFESLFKIKNLPKNTDIYCAHEYTIDNIGFALSLEPENQDLLSKKLVSQKLIGQNQSTMPTTLENELKTNPFLRSNSLELRNSLNIDKNKSDLEVFTITRNTKNNFKLL